MSERRWHKYNIRTGQLLKTRLGQEGISDEEHSKLPISEQDKYVTLVKRKQ